MKHDLSPNQAKLLECMQSVNFGKVKRLHFRNGQPVFDPQPHVVKKFKFDGENGCRLELGLKDFRLKDNAMEFFSQLSRLENGIVECLEIQHGLPISMEVEDLGEM
jgi:hypothetical protein